MNLFPSVCIPSLVIFAPQRGNAKHTTSLVARHPPTIGQHGGRGERSVNQRELEAVGGQMRVDAVRPLDERHVGGERGAQLERRALVDGTDAVEVEVVQSACDRDARWKDRECNP